MFAGISSGFAGSPGNSSDGDHAHMNTDHADAMILLARKYAGIASTEAAMTAVGRLGFISDCVRRTALRVHGSISPAKCERRRKPERRWSKWYAKPRHRLAHSCPLLEPTRRTPRGPSRTRPLSFNAFDPALREPNFKQCAMRVEKSPTAHHRWSEREIHIGDNTGA